MAQNSTERRILERDRQEHHSSEPHSLESCGP
jgi:hypothetical protein